MTSVAYLNAPSESPAFRRLASLVKLDEPARAVLRQAIGHHTIIPRRAEILIEGREIVEPRLVIDGWAARVRILADGRRQLLSFLLPGDFIGLCSHKHPLAVSNVVAITALKTCSPPDASALPDLKEAYALSLAHEEAYLLAQVTRLGRLSAQERICDLFLEFHERLSLCGQARNGMFNFPMT